MASNPFLSLYGMFSNPIGFFADVERRQGRVAAIPMGPRQFYLIHEPAMIQDVLVTQSSHFEKFPRVEPSKGLFGQGLLTSEEPLHLSQRRLMQPAFHHQRIQAYAAQMSACTERLMTEWQSGSVIDAAGAMNRLALNIVTHTLFSTAADHQAAEIARELDIVLHALNQLIMPWGDLWLKLPFPSSRRYGLALSRLDKIIHTFIAQRRTANMDRSDFLSMLLSGGAMADRQVRDELMTIFVAGHDTTANGLTWALYLLARHPELQRALAAQVRDVLGSGMPESDDYPKLCFVEHAFAEALRLYPPVWILGRKAIKQYQFDNFQAKPGSVLLVCMAVLHRNPAFFPEPDRFLPERWQLPSWPRYAYLPFGAGSRMCIGERFAWMEGVLCLSALLNRFQFELTEDAPPVPQGLLTLRPKAGLRLRITQ